MKRFFYLFAFILILAGVFYGVRRASHELEAALDSRQSGFVPVAQRNTLDTRAQAISATPTQVPIELISAIDTEDQVLINLYQRVNPSVVNIEVTQRTSAFDGFAANASGFVYDMQGHIVTNAHVVVDAVEILVTFSDGFVTSAEIVGLDEYSDLAVIRVNVLEERLLPVSVGDSSLLLVGQRVVAIGNPFGLQSSMTRGIISALGRALPSSRLINQASQRFNNPSIIQVDVIINPGNSGGPLLSYSGEVVGVNSAIRTESGIFEGVAFAIPSNTLKRIVPQLIQAGRAKYSWLGVSTFPEGPGMNIASLADRLGLPVDYGVMIEDVTDGSPAEQAGLRGGDRVEKVRGVDLVVGGDIIIAVNNVSVRDLDHLLAYLVENTAPGDTVTLSVMRASETLEIAVRLGVRPE